MIFLFLPAFLHPFFITVILNNLGVYKNLSKRTRIIYWVVTTSLVFLMERFGHIGHLFNINGWGLFFLYLGCLAFYTIPFQTSTDIVLKKARWIFTGITVFVMLGLHWMV